MKTQILGLMLLFGSIASNAQPPKPPSIEERLKRTNEMMLKEVQTSAEQLVVIEKNFAAFFKKADKLRKDNPPPQPPPPDPTIKAALDKLAQERDDNIKKVLTPDQYKRYQAIVLRLEPPRKHGPPPPPPMIP